jgi:hypothetical protein
MEPSSAGLSNPGHYVAAHNGGFPEAALDLQRAEQWMPTIERNAWQSFIPPVCRGHYGGILTAVGRWEEAER